MKKTILSITSCALVLLLTAACGSSSSGGSSNTTAGTAGRSSSQVGVASGHLVDANGYALYVTSASCTGSCLTVWPPFDATSLPTASGGATQANLGLSGGQVTYKGQALYYFESDTSPSQATGNGVGGFVFATP